MRSLSQKISHRLPLLVFLLCILQPCLDVLSYWLNTVEISNALTLGLRFLMLLALLVLGILYSRRRWMYWGLFGLLAVLTAGHIWACSLGGYNDPMGDLANMLRIYQLPLLTLCFLTLLKKDPKVYKAMQYGMLSAFGIIIAVELLSWVTDTNPYTYANKQIGLLGWFFVTSSQSAIVSMLAPIAIGWVLEKHPEKSGWVAAVVFGSLLVLFLFATRLAYMSLLLTAVGFLVILLISDRKRKNCICILLAAIVVFSALLPLSPMEENQRLVGINAVKKQETIDRLIAVDEELLEGQDLSEEEFALKRLEGAYDFYLGSMVRRFGLSRVAELYDYSDQASDLCDVRRMRISYCNMLMEDSEPMNLVFGLELSDMYFDDFIFDVENDLYGVFFLSGGLGLLLMLLFLGFFILRAFCALCKRPKEIFCVPIGGWAIAFLTCLAHIQFTSGVLRRPNASFYLSVLLSCLLFLVLRNVKNQKGQIES